MRTLILLAMLSLSACAGTDAGVTRGTGFHYSGTWRATSQYCQGAPTTTYCVTKSASQAPAACAGISILDVFGITADGATAWAHTGMIPVSVTTDPNSGDVTIDGQAINIRISYTIADGIDYGMMGIITYAPGCEVRYNRN